MKIIPSVLFLSCIIFFELVSQKALYGQLPLKIPQDNKPIFKDGQFYFYGSSPTKRTVPFQQGSQPTPLSAPCNSCTVQSSPTRSVITSGPIILYITSNDATCGYGSGNIVVQAANGTAPYTFNLDGYNPQLTGNFPIVGAGIHIITVTDASGVTTSATVIIKNILPGPVIVPYFISANPSSCNSSDGSVELHPSGGTPPYLYSMDLINFQTSNVISGLAPGNYNFYAKDANGCIGMSSDFIFGTNLCQYSFTQSIPTKVCGNQAVASVSEIGATNFNGTFNGPYSYSIDGINYQNTGDFNNLSAGIYKIYIKDVAGMINIYGFNIVENCFVTIQYIAVSAACRQNNGSLSVTATNGTAPYLYTIDGINYQASNVFSGLAPGNYYITVKDATSVTSSLMATVYDRCPVVEAVASDETCAKNDGTITAAGFKGTAPYQYSIDGMNFQNSNSFPGLAAGTYTVTIKDALGFTSTVSATINYNCLKLSTVIVNTTCGNPNGSISATATNGTAPYQFSIDGINFTAAGLFNNLAAASYTITVKDANGLTVSTPVAVLNIPAPQLTIIPIPASCKNNDGSLFIKTSSGTAPFQYSLDGVNFSSTNAFNNISAGTTITAYVKDANGCIANQTITITADCPLPAFTVTDETCGSKNGSINASASGGTSPYQYAIDGVNFQGGGVFNGLASGNYTITVKDGDGYVNTTNAVIADRCPTVTAITSPGLCGTANATITAVGADGTEPYQYAIDGLNFQSSNVFKSLISGSYIVTVKDATGLVNTTTITVTNIPGPQAIASATAASCLNNDGTIQAVNMGGTPPFQYSLDGINFQNKGIFSGLDTGTKTVIIKDNNDCPGSVLVIVPLSDNLTLSTGSDVTLCEGVSTSLSATSNAMSYAWFPSTGLSNPALINPSASPVVNTTYYVTAQTGICSRTDSLHVFVEPAPVANAGPDTSTCYGKSISLSGSGGGAYLWSPVQNLNDPAVPDPTVINPKNTATYSLVVTDANGCRSINPAMVTVHVTPPPKIFAGNDTSVIINQPLQLNAVDENNSGFSDYLWSPDIGLNNPGVANPVALITGDISYTVTAVTPDGCAGTGIINIKTYTVSDIFVPNAFSPDGNGRNDILKAIPIGIKELRYFSVFNRWGSRVFFIKNQSSGWDGTINGQKQPAGTYVWMAGGVDYKGKSIERRGTVILIR